MRALMVEDNAKLAEYVQIGLGRRGITLDCVATTAEADAALATVAYEAIVLDLGLPDQDGKDVAIAHANVVKAKLVPDYAALGIGAKGARNEDSGSRKRGPKHK